MKQLLIDTILFDATPTQINESRKENNGKVIVTGVLQRAEAKNQNGRIYPKQILMREAKKYAEGLIKENRALGELDHPDCARSSAEILTLDGWKLLKDVMVGELIPSLNTETNIIENQPIQRVINQKYSGKMISIVGKNIDVMVTPNHRFYLRDRHGKYVVRTAQDLYNSMQDMVDTHLSIPISKNDWIGEDMSKFILPAYTNLHKRANKKYVSKVSTPLELEAKAFFGFLGFYLAEGHCANRSIGHSSYSVSITQNKGEVTDRFIDMVKSMSPDLEWKVYNKGANSVTITCYDPRLWSYVNELGNKYTKYVPANIKNASKELLSELFSWFLNGDGTTTTYNGYTNNKIFSVSKKLMEDFQEILLKLGIASVIKKSVDTNDYMFADHLIKASSKSPLYTLKLKKSANVHIDARFLKITEVDYDDTVHCVTVENGNFYCRDNGFPHWTGNSSVINLKNVSHNVLGIHWKGDDLVGKVEILPTPSGNILQNLLGAGIKLGISSRGMGSVKELSEGTVEVQDDFELIGWDFVSNPSTHGAFMYPVSEGLLRESVDINTIAKIDPTIQRIHENITMIICEIGNVCECIFDR